MEKSLRHGPPFTRRVGNRGSATAPAEVLSALETFHQQLEASLGKEVAALQTTLKTLESAQTTQSGEVRAPGAGLQPPGGTAVIAGGGIKVFGS